jgi:branched-subunit amino acid aminotransferase/4-amino-4-deoxychorismate lyase
MVTPPMPLDLAKVVKLAPPGLPLTVADEIVRIVWLLWVDGRIVPRHEFHIDPNDEGLLFGRGVWESTRTIAGVPWLWQEHLDRLQKTAKILEFSVDAARLPTVRQVHEYVRTLTAMDVVIRLNATAGRIGRPGLIWMACALPPAPMPSIRLRTAPTPVAEGHPEMAWKTFQYHRRLRVGGEAGNGFDSALLLDRAGNLLEAAHANVFVRLPDGWATPSIDEGLFLPGIVRQQLLKASPLPIQERTIPRSLLGEIQEGFLTNSSVGIVPISQIDERPIPTGRETRELAKWLLPHHSPGGEFRFVTATS